MVNTILTDKGIRANTNWLVQNATRLNEAGVLDISRESLIKMNVNRRYNIYKRLLNTANNDEFASVTEWLNYNESKQQSFIKRMLQAIFG